MLELARHHLLRRRLERGDGRHALGLQSRLALLDGTPE